MKGHVSDDPEEGAWGTHVPESKVSTSPGFGGESNPIPSSITPESCLMAIPFSVRKNTPPVGSGAGAGGDAALSKVNLIELMCPLIVGVSRVVT